MSFRLTMRRTGLCYGKRGLLSGDADDVERLAAAQAIALAASPDHTPVLIPTAEHREARPAFSPSLAGKVSLEEGL